MCHCIRRVTKDEISISCLVNRFFKVRTLAISIFNNFAHLLEIIIVIDKQIFTSFWNIELSIFVDSIDPVEARTVKVQESNGSLLIVVERFTPHFIVKFVGMPAAISY